MSHVTKVKTRLKDAQVLRQSLEKIGYHVREGGVISGQSSSRKGHAVEILARKGGSRIGFRRSADEASYEVLADWELQKKGRQTVINEILQAYSREKVIKLAGNKGYSVIGNRTNRHGQVEIVLRKAV